MEKIYLTNKTLLEELNRAKATYCYFVNPDYSIWDGITEDINEVTPAFLEEVCAAKAKRTKAPATIEGLIIRVMTTDHIPPEYVFEGRTPRGSVRLPFPAFKHYRVVDGELVEVGRSHWTGGLDNGYFVRAKGKVTNRLAKMWMELAKRYAHRGNFRGYSFRADMEANGILRLCEVGLQFNEARTLNPFAYWTQVLTHVYQRAIVVEGNLQTLRDDILISAGKMPSMKRQIADADAAAGIAPPTKLPGKRGRPRKVVTA